MDVIKLKKLVEMSGLSKQVIAEKCEISRPTLDNVLNGSDAKISTIESLASFFNVPVGHLFGTSNVNQTFNGESNVVVGRDNNGNIAIAKCQDELEDAKIELAHAKQLIKEKDKQLEEKERLISVLMKK
ncbi:helix-turn-helix domain-containing protein [Bacteroides ihuae]|uniref:helix-turn-helix domain-containing protein n=1 Tax=Bacteroides ihuae TaxID=1852362 RepID=UPI0008DA1B64|nr:helix-turn-helix transcriptional regulator [Bacteroides ihuae]